MTAATSNDRAPSEASGPTLAALKLRIEQIVAVARDIHNFDSVERDVIAAFADFLDAFPATAPKVGAKQVAVRSNGMRWYGGQPNGIWRQTEAATIWDFTDCIVVTPFSLLRPNVEAVLSTAGRSSPAGRNVGAEWKPTGMQRGMPGGPYEHEWFRASDGSRQMYPRGFDPNLGHYGGSAFTTIAPVAATPCNEGDV